MSTCMIYNYCVHRSTVSASLCLVVMFCCHMSNEHTDVLFERINDEDDHSAIKRSFAAAVAIRLTSHLRFCRATKLQHANVHVAHCNFVAWTRTDQSAWSEYHVVRVILHWVVSTQYWRVTDRQRLNWVTISLFWSTVETVWFICVE